MVVGGGGRGLGIWGEKREENTFFPTAGHIYNLQDSLSKLILLRKIQLLVLSEISLLAGFALSELVSLSELFPLSGIAFSELV